MNMDLPSFPDKLRDVIQCLDTREKTISWNIHNTEKKITLNIVWKGLSISAHSDSKQRKQQEHACGCTQPVSRATNKNKKKKKSPSRLL